MPGFFDDCGKEDDITMLYLPKAYENIVVGLKWNGCFGWYVSYKEMWFLDQNVLIEAYMEKAHERGIPPESTMSEEDERYGIPVLNEDNIDLFLGRIAKYSAAVSELREHLKQDKKDNGSEEVFYDWLPALYIDFDEKVLYSLYTEPASFEDYVPQGWRGYYRDFLKKIEPHDRFWCEGGQMIFDFEKGDQQSEG